MAADLNLGCNKGLLAYCLLTWGKVVTQLEIEEHCACHQSKTKLNILVWCGWFWFHNPVNRLLVHVTMWQITSWTVNTGSKSTRTTQFLWFTSVWFAGVQLDIWVNTQQAVWSVDGREELNNYWWFHQSHTLVWVWFGFGNCGLPSTPWLRETLVCCFSGLGGTGQGRNHSLTVFTPEPDSVSEKQETGCALPPWCAAGRCTFTL